jgi:hypothetical protein
MMNIDIDIDTKRLAIDSLNAIDANANSSSLMRDACDLLANYSKRYASYHAAASEMVRRYISWEEDDNRTHCPWSDSPQRYTYMRELYDSMRGEN